MKKSLRIGLEILFLSLSFGFLAYLLDAVLGYFIFYREGFWNLLIFAVPRHMLFTRLVIIALFALSGILIIRLVSSRLRTLNNLSVTEAKLDATLGCTGDAVITIDASGNITSMNQTAEKVTGWKIDEASGRSVDDVFYTVDAVTSKKIESPVRGILKNGGVENSIKQSALIRRDGTKILIGDGAAPILDDSGKIGGAVLVFRDDSERINAEEEIKKSEQKFRSIVESSPMGMHFYRLESDGRLIFVGANPAADKLLGLDNKQFIGKTIEEAFPGSEGTEIPDRYRAAASKGEIWRSEQINYVDERIQGAFQVVAFQTTKNRMVSMFFDITEQKIIEKELKESEERFRSTFEQAAVGIAHVAPDGNLIRINQRFCDIVGYPREELLQRTFQDITHPDDVERDVEFLRRMLSGELKIHSIEKRYCRKDGAVVWANLTTTLLSDNNGTPKYFISVIEDISDRKKAEEALKRTQFSVDKSVDVVFWVDSDARFIDVNEAACQALGYTREELLTMTVQDIDIGFPKDKWLAYWKKLKQKGSFIVESTHKAKNGRIYPVEIAVNYFKVDGKEYNCAFARDISERKAAEEALRESEEKFRNLSEQSPNMIFINKGGRIVYVNIRCEEIMGYKKEEFYSPDFDFFKLIAPEYLPMIKDKYERHLKGEDVEPYEYALLAKDGRRIEGIINTKIIHYEGENSLLGIITDITDRRRAEEAIKESEEKFRTVAEQSPNMIFINKQGQVVYANNKCEEIMGYIKEEFYSSDFDFLTIIAPEYVQDINDNFARHMKGEEIEPFEYALIAKDGRRIDSIINTRLIKYEGEISILGIVTDITDRKRAERAVQKSQRDLEKAQQIAKIGSWEWDILAEKIYWSDEMYRIFGIEKEIELTLELVRKSIYPEDLGIFEKATKDVFNKISPKFIEYRIIKTEGDITFVQSTAECQYDDQGSPIRIIGTVQDITERKKAEELREKLIADLQKAANEIKTLSGLIPICASCKKIRDDKGYWEQIETYIMEHSDAEFSHGLCPECSKKLYPDL